MLCLQTKRECLSGSSVKHRNRSVRDLYSHSSCSHYCRQAQEKQATGNLISTLKVYTHCEIRCLLSEPQSSLTTSSRNVLPFAGIYATSGWEYPAIGSHCILPALSLFSSSSDIQNCCQNSLHPIPLPTST